MAIHGRHGFTIVELAVVIAVIGILMGVVIVVYPGIQKRTADTETQGDLQQAAIKVEAFKANTGGYPLTQNEVNNGNGLPKSSEDRSYTYIATAGTYCISSTSEQSGKTFKVTNASSEVVEGECEQLAAPTNVAATWNGCGHTATWNTVVGATSYRMQYSFTSSFSSIEIDTAGIVGTSSFIYYAIPGYVRIASNGPMGQGPWSAVAATTGTPPGGVCGV